MDLINFINSHHLHTISYLVLFLGTFLDAILSIFAGVFLVIQGALRWWIMFPVLLVGVLCEQLFWYGVGHYLGKSNKVLHWTNKFAARFDRHFHDKPFRTLFISKFLYGGHRPSLMRAGMIHIPLKKFMKAAFPGASLWFIIIASLSAGLGASYQLLKRYLSYAGLIVLGILIGLFVVEYFVSKRLRKEV